MDDGPLLTMMLGKTAIEKSSKRPDWMDVAWQFWNVAVPNSWMCISTDYAKENIVMLFREKWWRP